ncbi:hypothetical protein HD806DRAFT_510329 [Xylariaceae sp. AK1471]|nr:hypothetical protein HD806DRAFT_510329 [Xylariaceae sp. AK1471]
MLHSRRHLVDIIARIARLVLSLFLFQPLVIFRSLAVPSLAILIVITGFCIFIKDFVEVVNSNWGRPDPHVSSITVIFEGLLLVLLLSVILVLWKFVSPYYFQGKDDFSIFIQWELVPWPVTFILSLFIEYGTMSRYLQERQRDREFTQKVAFTPSGEPRVVLVQTRTALNPAYNASMDSLLQQTGESYRMETFRGS